ncbi:MAG TPA: CvpA family protein [Rhodobacteraceae bacterium]|nr:CvpA family protein [Paracoccaceae bacterium]
MEGFTIVDGVVAVVIILSALLAYSRGFVREALAIGGWIVAAILAFLFAGQAEPLIREVPILGDFIKDSCELSRIAAFAAVFAVGLIVMSLITPLFSSIVQRSALGGIDQGLGFLFGVARGILLVAIGLVVYDRVITDQAVPMIDDSRTARIFAKMQDSINDNIPEDAPGWIVARYEQLVGECGKPATTPAPQAPANN